MPCLFAVFEICHRSHSPLCSLFQIPKPTKIQVKIAQLILSPLLSNGSTFLLPSPTTSFSFSVFSKFFLLPFDFLEALGVFNAAALFFKNIDGRLARDVKGMACRMGD